MRGCDRRHRRTAPLQRAGERACPRAQPWGAALAPAVAAEGARACCRRSLWSSPWAWPRRRPRRHPATTTQRRPHCHGSPRTAGTSGLHGAQRPCQLQGRDAHPAAPASPCRLPAPCCCSSARRSTTAAYRRVARPCEGRSSKRTWRGIARGTMAAVKNHHHLPHSTRRLAVSAPSAQRRRHRDLRQGGRTLSHAMQAPVRVRHTEQTARHRSRGMAASESMGSRYTGLANPT